MYSFTWEGDFQGAVVWYPYAAVVLKRLLVVGAVAHSETPISGVSIVLRTAPPHIHIVAAGGLYFILAYSDSLESGYAALRVDSEKTVFTYGWLERGTLDQKEWADRVLGVNTHNGRHSLADWQDTANITEPPYLFHKSQINSGVEYRLSRIQRYVSTSSNPTYYFNVPRFDLNTAPGFGLHDSVLGVTMYDADLQLQWTKGFSQNDATTPYLEGLNLQLSGEFRVIDCQFQAVTDDQYAVANQLSNQLYSARLSEHGIPTHFIVPVPLLLRLDGDAIVKAMSFDMYDHYPLNVRAKKDSAFHERFHPRVYDEAVHKVPRTEFTSRTLQPYYLTTSSFPHQTPGFLKAVTTDDDYIYAVGVFLGGPDYALKDGVLYYVTEVIQGFPAHYGPLEPYKFIGVGPDGVTSEVKGGHLRPHITAPLRDDPRLAVEYTGGSKLAFNEGTGEYEMVDSEYGEEYMEIPEGSIRRSACLGTILKFNKQSLELLDARCVYQNTLFTFPSLEGESVVTQGLATAVAVDGASVYTTMNSGGDLRGNASKFRFAVVCRWTKDLTQLLSYKILGQPRNLVLNTMVLSGSTLFVAGSYSEGGRVYPIVAKINALNLVVSAAVMYRLSLGDSRQLEGVINSIELLSGKLVAAGLVFSNDLGGPFSMVVDPDKLTAGSARVVESDNPVGEYRQTKEGVAVGVSGDTKTGIGGVIATLGASSGPVSELEDATVTPVQIEEVPQNLGSSSSGLGSFYATTEIKKFMREETFTTFSVEKESVGGSF